MRFKGTTRFTIKRYKLNYDEVFLDMIHRLAKTNVRCDNYAWAKLVYDSMLVKSGSVHLVGKAKELTDAIFAKEKPYDVEVLIGNVWLNTGINNMFKLLTGSGGTAYTSANALLQLGNNGTTPVATQTGLLGTSTASKPMDTGFPKSGLNQLMEIQATFGPTDALFSIKEQSLSNGVVNLFRANKDLGNKSLVSETWTIQGSISGV